MHNYPNLSFYFISTFPAISLSTSSAVEGSAPLSLTQLAILINPVVVLDADSQLLFRNINSRLDGERHSRSERHGVIPGIVDVQSDVVAEAVNEILAQRLAALVFAVSVDVVVSDLMSRVTPVRVRLDLPD